MELRVMSDDLAPQRLQALTEELAYTLRREARIDATLPQEEAEAGARGEPITIGLLILTALTSGAAGAFFNSVSAFFQRSHKLEFELEREDGRRLTLKSENVSEDERERTLARLETFLDD